MVTKISGQVIRVEPVFLKSKTANRAAQIADGMAYEVATALLPNVKITPQWVTSEALKGVAYLHGRREPLHLIFPKTYALIHPDLIPKGQSHRFVVTGDLARVLEEATEIFQCTSDAQIRPHGALSHARANALALLRCVAKRRPMATLKVTLPKGGHTLPSVDVQLPASAINRLILPFRKSA